MILADQMSTYLAGLVPEPDPVLAEMQEHGRRDGIPIVMPETGELLEVIATAVAARRAVEVGTAIGVSTLHLARAVGEGGLVVSFEVDETRHRAAADYLRRAGVADRVELHLQDASAGMAALEPGFDLAFLDGLKSDYPRHLDLALPLLRQGGVVLVDNVLMGGTVASGRSDGRWADDAIAGMRRFNAALLGRDDLSATVLPVGDGVAVAVKR